MNAPEDRRVVYDEDAHPGQQNERAVPQQEQPQNHPNHAANDGLDDQQLEGNDFPNVMPPLEELPNIILQPYLEGHMPNDDDM